MFKNMLVPAARLQPNDIFKMGGTKYAVKDCKPQGYDVVILAQPVKKNKLESILVTVSKQTPLKIYLK